MLQISNLTPDSFAPGAEPADVHRPKKRQRKVLSCDACHRQKVKCDRKLPCSRCIAANRADQCFYEGDKTPPATMNGASVVLQQPSPAASDSTASVKTNRKPVGTTWRKGRARFSGMTHWAQLAFQFEEAAPFMRGSELATLMNKVKQLKKFYPPKRLRAFPFGDAGGNSVLSTHPRLSFLPPKLLAEQLVENYLVTYEMTHPLLDVQAFRDEFDRLWKQPESIADSWLAQLYLMIALSCYSAHDISFCAVAGGHVGLSERCVDGAEAALMARGLFVTKPDLTTLRAFCMLVIAKRIDIVTLDDLDSQWTFMGFVERLAMSMSLHIGTSAFPAMPDAEATSRGRIWNTILVLDSYVSLDSGLPMLLRPDDYSPSALLQPEPKASPALQKDESPKSASPNDPYQNLLAETMPTISLILNRLNSPSPTLDPGQLAACDRSLRNCLQRAQTYLPFPHNDLMAVLLLRCSMAIHQPRALEGESTEGHPSTSLRILNESALALIQIQKKLWEEPAHRWLAELFHRDFGIAGLVISVGLRNNTITDKLGNPSITRALAWTALRSDHGVIKENVLRSRHYFKIFRAFSVLIGILEALENGTSIREAVYKAGLMVITTVEECVGRQLDIQISESIDPMFRHGSNGPLDVNLGPGTFGFDDFISDFFW